MRSFKIIIAGLVLLSALTACKPANVSPSPSPAPTPIPYASAADITDADTAFKRLEDGNMNFLLGNRSSANVGKDVRIPLWENGQKPYAAVLTCSDSQVAPEFIFDAGLGDLYVIRNAGNVVGDYELGSIEYAAGELNVPLIVVMGHTGCSAVAKTIAGNPTGNFKSIADYISPVQEDAQEYLGQPEYQGLCEDINITIALDKIAKDPYLKDMIKGKKVRLVGGKYSTAAGRVMFNWA